MDRILRGFGIVAFFAQLNLIGLCLILKEVSGHFDQNPEHRFLNSQGNYIVGGALKIMSLGVLVLILQSPNHIPQTSAIMGISLLLFAPLIGSIGIAIRGR
jgi:hypothetical protein